MIVNTKSLGQSLNLARRNHIWRLSVASSSRNGWIGGPFGKPWTESMKKWHARWLSAHLKVKYWRHCTKKMPFLEVRTERWSRMFPQLAHGQQADALVKLKVAKAWWKRLRRLFFTVHVFKECTREASAGEKFGKFLSAREILQMANLFMNKSLRQAASLKRASGLKGGIKRDAVVLDGTTEISL